MAANNTNEKYDSEGVRDTRVEVPRWLQLLVAVLVALVAGQAAGILLVIGGAAAASAIWTATIAFGSTLLVMMTVISFLNGER